MDTQQTLKEALGLIHSDGKSYYWVGHLLDAQANLGAALFDDRSLEPTYQAVCNIGHDIWNVCTLATRMEWFRTLTIQDKSLTDSFYWALFTGLDIELFHVELRSILDYVASILGTTAQKTRQVPSASFNELYQWLSKNPGNRARLGEEASELVSSASWYAGLRDMRDAIVHHGAHTLVFGSPKDGILFQLLHGLKPLINTQLLTWKENVIDFQLYAGLYVARTFVLLEGLGRFLAARIPQRLPNPQAKANYYGFTILRDWMSRLLAKVQD